MAQGIRDYFGKPVTINNWHNLGKYEQSGFRRNNTLVGSKYSQHKFGRAIDIKITGVNPVEVQTEIKLKYDQVFKDPPP